MSRLGVDFSFAPINAEQLVAGGFSFAARYLASSSGKRLKASEIADFKANGIDIVLVWEDEATAALEGFNRGQHDAQVATEQAEALGIPADIPIYLAVDFDINDAEKPVAAEYFKGAASISSRFRAGYGGYYLIKYLFDAGLIDWAWQTVAWSGGQVDPRAHIYQNGESAFGGQADIDEARQTNFGQWPAQGGNMPSITGIDEARILAWGVGGRNGLDGHANALNGEVDDELNKNHVGHNLDDDLRSWYNSTEGQDWVHDRLPALVAKAALADSLQKKLDELNNKVPVTVIPSKPLPHLDPMPVPSNSSPTPPQKPIGGVSKSFWQSLFWWVK